MQPGRRKEPWDGEAFSLAILGLLLALLPFALRNYLKGLA